MVQFKDYSLQPFLQEAIQRIGFTHPTPIQEAMIPMILKKKSAIGQAHTGTGKSHSFLIPIVERLEVEEERVQAIITAPTRELAEQLHLELRKLIDETSLHSMLLIGGTDKLRTMEKLERQPHIVIGTPGRIRDLVEEQALQVHEANILVIDEADLAFDMGFIEDIDYFASRMPKTLEMYVFSATIPENLRPFLNKYMSKPEHIQIGSKRPLTDGMHYSLVPVRSAERYTRLRDVMSAINPYLAIIFVNTRDQAEQLAQALAKDGIPVGQIHGDLTPRERRRMMRRIRDLEYQYIVATDLASRGIDIPGVSHVINYELPQDLQYFIHRVGRTARAGLEGHAITLYRPSDEEDIDAIEAKGVPFTHEDVKDGEWVQLRPRQSRERRKKTTPKMRQGSKRTSKGHRPTAKERKRKR